MSRSDESDEEVYLSDPSSDEEDVKSVEDFEYSNDQQGALGYEKVSERHTEADEFDYALHDAEAEQAKLRKDELASTPRRTALEEQKKTALSPDAAPWVPGKKLAVPEQASEGLKAFASSDFPALPAVEAKSDRAGLSTSTGKPKEPSLHPEKHVASEEFNSPIDVNGMLARAVASEQQSKPKENGIREGTAPAAAAAKKESPSAAEQHSAEKAKPSAEHAKAQTAEAKPPTEQIPSSYAAVLTRPPQPADSKQETAEEIEQPEEKTYKSYKAVEQSEEKTVNIVEQLEEEAAKEIEQPSKVSDAAEEGNTPAPEKAAAVPKMVGMPKLPERKKPASAMPALPSRPAKKAAPKLSSSRQEEPPAPEPGNLNSEDQGSEETGSDTEEIAGDAAAVPGHSPPVIVQEVSRAPPANGQREMTAQQLVNLLNPNAARQSPSQAPTEAERRASEKLRELRIALWRIASRLNFLSHNLPKATDYRLDLSERSRLHRGNEAQDAGVKQIAQDLEREAAGDVFDVTALVIGITGGGKSSLINSLLGEEAVHVDPFTGTRGIQLVEGVASGLKLRLIDTPGLEPSAGSLHYNMGVLQKIDRARKRYKPDLLIYCDRFDLLRRDSSDIPLLKQISEHLGGAAWFNSIAVLTHSAAPCPIGQNNQPIPFHNYSQARAAVAQRVIQVAASDRRMSVPTAFAENSPTCETNSAGEAVLPNQIPWRRELLMVMACSKLLRDADEILQLSGSGSGPSDPQTRLLQQLFQQPRGQKMPPLQYLVPNMIRHAGPKQYPDHEKDIKREDEIRAIKNPARRRAEARKRNDYLKSRQAERRVSALPASQVEGTEGTEAPSPGPALAVTFDSEDTSHYYRTIEPRGGEAGWLTRPRSDQNCYDHTDGVDSLTTERTFLLRPKDRDLGGIPAAVHAIVQKDKVNSLIQADAEASLYQSWRLAHTTRLQVLQLAGKDILYVSQLESQLSAPMHNKATLGGLVARLGEEGAPPTKGLVALGYKVEEDIELPTIPKYNCKSAIKGGIAKAFVNLPGNRKEKATGLNAEWQMVAGKHENIQAVASLSQMEYRGNKGSQLTVSAALPITGETTIAPKLQTQLQQKQGSFTLRITSHDHSNVGLAILLPLGKTLWDKLRNGRS